MKTLEQIFDVIESKDISINKYTEDNKLCGYELNTYTDGGVNQIIFLDFRDTKYNVETPNDFLHVFGKYIMSIDIDDEITSNRLDETYKKAFSLGESIKDFTAWKDELILLNYELNSGSIKTVEHKFNETTEKAYKLVSQLEDLFADMPSKGDTGETCQRQLLYDKIKALEYAINGIAVDDFEEDNWKCTDPDLQQYGRKVSEGVYEFKELARGLDDYEEGEYVELTIKMVDYNAIEIEQHISAYYSSIEEIKETYDDDWEFIVAECIFEQESGLY